MNIAGNQRLSISVIVLQKFQFRHRAQFVAHAWTFLDEENSLLFSVNFCSSFPDLCTCDTELRERAHS